MGTAVFKLTPNRREAACGRLPSGQKEDIMKNGQEGKTSVSVASHLLLFEQMWKHLSKKEQIDEITVLIEESIHDGELIPLLEKLKAAFHPDLIGYRRHLKYVYEQLLETAVLKAYPALMPKLKTAILAEILEGWFFWYDEPKDLPKILRFSDDAQACLKFVCDAYRSSFWEKTESPLSKKIIDIISNHFGHQPLTSDILTPWILLDFIPPEIATILMKIRIAMDPKKAVRELILIKSFDLSKCSAIVVQIAKTFLSDLKKVEDITVVLVERINVMGKSMDFPDEQGTKPRLEVRYSFSPSGNASILVHFYYPPVMEYSKCLGLIQAEREKLIRGTNILPEKIRIVLKDPEGILLNP